MLDMDLMARMRKQRRTMAPSVLEMTTIRSVSVFIVPATPKRVDVEKGAKLVIKVIKNNILCGRAIYVYDSKVM